ncbi:hypothetical protein V6N11_025437 [Hibiscus sabdariffa]|uniref:Uncharacterized protein n=2 Tax=Hibiscus sabdariffa TaxID=183260 RepID=A0ABR2N9X8_9ROSI
MDLCWGVVVIGNIMEGALTSGSASRKPKEGGACCSVVFVGVQKLGLKAGWKVTGDSVTGVWLHWGVVGKCSKGSHSIVLLGTWRCVWRWPWCCFGRSKAESKGGSKVTGEREGGKFESSAGSAVLWETFPWLCEAAGQAGYPKITCGILKGRLSEVVLLIIWRGLDIRIAGWIRCVFVPFGCGIKRIILFICFRNIKRSVLWGGLEEKERRVLWSRWVGVKRCVLEEKK